MTPLSKLFVLGNLKKKIAFYIISIGFVLANILFMSKENYYVNIIPFAFLIILLTIFALDKLILLVVFFTPLSIQLRELIPHLSIDMSLPTEPLMFGILLLFLFKLIIEKNYDKKIARHPIAIAIYINLGWIFITSLTSTIPLVSIKFFVSRCWFLIVFFFVAALLFKDLKNIYRYFWCYMIPMLIVIGFTLFRLSGYGLFNEKMAHEVMNPIFNDHTSYAAVIAMFVPILLGFIVSTKLSLLKQTLSAVVLGIFLIAIIFSYTRASWISLAVALLFWILLKLKIKLKAILISALVLFALFWSFKTEIFMKMEKNRQDSSTNITQHIQSMSNVTSDASNVERLNRWSCAVRMFYEKPFLGWGPGTYQFQYAPFQLASEKTIISTNAGNRGNAHSEYIGPLAESGFLGTITFTIIVLLTLYRGSMVYRNSKDKNVRLLALTLLLGLTTYYVHGLMNNFLDTDKASALFWGFTAMIVALDIYHKGEKNSAAVTTSPENEKPGELKPE
jgi:putative inorganic carbon (hco3(-)) transporter